MLDEREPLQPIRFDEDKVVQVRKRGYPPNVKERLVCPISFVTNVTARRNGVKKPPVARRLLSSRGLFPLSCTIAVDGDRSLERNFNQRSTHKVDIWPAGEQHARKSDARAG